MSVEALAVYATCARQWWLQNQSNFHSPPYLRTAEISLARREQISTRLALVGVGLIGLAVLLILAGFLFS